MVCTQIAYSRGISLLGAFALVALLGGGGVRVTFEMEGGVAYFPGLNKPTVVDSDHLPSDKQARLLELVQQSDFFDLPGTIGRRPPGAADLQSYVITVSQGARKHTVRVIEGGQAPDLQMLIDFLRKEASAQRKQR